MARVLIIDDNENVCKFVAKALEDEHVVVSAPNGEAGMDAFRDAPFDMVITDIFMPGKDGIETIREIRQFSAATKIVAVSGGGGTYWSNTLKAAEMLGATHCLAKPFTVEQLQETVRNALAPQPVL